MSCLIEWQVDSSFLEQRNLAQVLSLLSLSDRYERKARLLPGIIAVLPIAVTVGNFMHTSTTWYMGLGIGTGIGAVLGIALSHLARATGAKLEDELKRRWDGLPTVRWLRPDDLSRSDEQKEIWRKAIKKLTGLEVPATDEDRLYGDRLRDDAVRQLRYKLRESPKAKMVSIHNEEYGFARNIAGLRWVCFTTAVIGTVASIIGFFFGYRPIVSIVISVLEACGAVGLCLGFEHYVQHAANRYAESLFAAAVLGTERSGPKAKAE